MTQWVDEVPALKGPQHPLAVYMERLRPLIQHPERWAQVASGTPSAMYRASSSLKLRQYHLPPGHWEFTVREFRRGVHIKSMKSATLYARYLGPTEDHGDPGLIARDATYDDEGRRICPECLEPLKRPARRFPGPWPKLCRWCWSKQNTKWARRKYRA